MEPSPQYRLWARAIVSEVHAPNSPMFNGGLQKQPKELLANAFAGAATAIAKVKQPPDMSATGHSVHFSPGKKVDIRMRNLFYKASWKMAKMMQWHRKWVALGARAPLAGEQLYSLNLISS